MDSGYEDLDVLFFPDDGTLPQRIKIQKDTSVIESYLGGSFKGQKVSKQNGNPFVAYVRTDSHKLPLNRIWSNIELRGKFILLRQDENGAKSLTEDDFEKLKQRQIW